MEQFAGGIEATLADRPPLATAFRVDVNRATVPELGLLPGIGRGRAEAIVLWRVRHGRFRALPDLEQVPGIGPDTVQRLSRFAKCRG